MTLRVGQKQTLKPIAKAVVAFLQLKNIWKAKILSMKSKIRIFNANAKAVLLDGAETWRNTVTIAKRTHTFVNNCLRRIHGVVA